MDTNTTLTAQDAQIGANGAETPVKENLAENTKPPYNSSCKIKNTAEFEGGTNSFVFNCTLASGGSQDERTDCMENSALTSDTSTADVDNVTEKPIDEEVQSPELRGARWIERGNVTQEEVDELADYVKSVVKLLPTPAFSAESEKKESSILFYILNDKCISGVWNEYGIQTFNKICQALKISPTVTSEPVEGGGRFNKHEYRYNWQFTYTDFMKILQFTAEKYGKHTTSKGDNTSPPFCGESLNYGIEILQPTDAEIESELSAVNSMSYSERDQLRRKINLIDLRGIFQLDRQCKGFICPICGNGSGDKGDGIVPTLKTDSKGVEFFIHHCFKCGGLNGKLNDIIANVNGLNWNAEKTLAIGLHILHLTENSNYSPPPVEFTVKSNEISQEELALIAADITDAQDRLAELPIEDRRGLSLNTLRRFQCGYLPNWIHTKNRIKNENLYPSRRLIIPTSSRHYVAVMLKSDRTAENKKYWKMHGGNKEIFNVADISPNAPVLVLEGEIDAMSILQATQGKYRVIALGGAAENSLFNLLKDSAISDVNKLNYSFVILFDSDSAGRTNAKKYVDALIQAGYPAVAMFLTNEDTKLDANDILTREGDAALASTIDKLVVDAENAFSQIREEVQRLNSERAASAKSQSQKAPATSGKQDKFHRLAELKQMPLSPERDAEIIKIINQLIQCNKNGTALINSYNANLIFKYDPCIDGLFAYDEFTGRELLKKNPSWDNNAAGRDIEDTDIARLRLYIRNKYREFHNEKLINDYIVEYSRRNSFHRVKEFLNNLPNWDGTPRAETLFIDYLNVTDTAYTREITIKWLIGAVARILHSGCNFQLTLVLTGRQGIGKSYLLERLSAGFFCKLVTNFDNDREAALIIQNAWLVEVEEFVAARKAEISSTKSFLTKTFDEYRVPYDKRPRKSPRHCVFAVTNNGNNFLRDLTGNRRYGILECGSRQSEWKGKLDDNFIQQVWSEVLVRYKEMFANGFDAELLNLSDAAEKYASSVADKFVADDDIQAEITSFLDIKLPPPEIWILLTKSERRSYIEKSFVFLYADDIEMRLATLPSKWTNNKEFTEKLHNLILASDDNKINNPSIVARKDANGRKFLKIYGSHYRQHICASEIYAECFSPIDRRKSISKIADILDRLTDWQQVGRKQHIDIQYADQTKCYYRVNDVDED